MTDREDNGREQAPAGFGLPTAGRKPPAADVPRSERDEPAADRPRLDSPVSSDETGPSVSSGASEPAVPELAVPESAVPELAVPESAVPELAVPELAVPEPEDTREGESVPEEISATSPVPSMSDTPETAAAESDLERSATKEKSSGLKRPSPAGTLIWVLLALLGFTLVVQLRSNDADSGLATVRQEDLVQILSDLEARDSRLNTDIAALEQSKQQLTSGVAGREAALEEASKRTVELGLLAGTVAGQGPGLEIVLDGVKSSDVLNTVQELRGSGGEVMQISGANGTSVRIVASTYFVDASGGGIIADGEQLAGPFRLLVIGSPETMRTALQIPGGVVASVKSDGGSVTMDSRAMVEVTAVRKATALQYARPVS